MTVNHNGVEYRVADAHAHIYPEKIAEKATVAIGKFYDISMDNIGIPHTLDEVEGKTGIEKTLVCSVATTVEQVSSINKFIYNKCEKYPRFIGLAAWHQDIENIDEMLDEIQKLGLKGIKLHPDFQRVHIDDERMLSFYQEANRRNLPVLFHTGDKRTDFSSPVRLMNVINKIPDFTCIAAHLGGYSEWEDAKKDLRGTNVYIDTSSSLFAVTKEEALESIHHFGVDRTMFGTDFPMWEPKLELERFFSLELLEKDNKKILFDNFNRLFFNSSL